MIEIALAGCTFAARSPFAEGHVCNATEAQALNAARAEALRVAFARRVKAIAGGRLAVAPHERELLQAEFAALDESFRLGGAASPADSISRRAREIARIKVIEALNAKGIDHREMPPDELEVKIAQASLLPAIIGEAQRQLAALRAAAESIINPAEAMP